MNQKYIFSVPEPTNNRLLYTYSYSVHPKNALNGNFSKIRIFGDLYTVFCSCFLSPRRPDRKLFQISSTCYGLAWKESSVSFINQQIELKLLFQLFFSSVPQGCQARSHLTLIRFHWKSILIISMWRQCWDLLSDRKPIFLHDLFDYYFSFPSCTQMWLSICSSYHLVLALDFISFFFLRNDKSSIE